VEVLRKRLEQQRPRLEEVERLRDTTLQTIERRREFLIREIETSYRNLISDLENGLRNQAADIEIGALQALFQRGDARKRVGERLQNWMRERSVGWRDTVLQGLIKSHVEAMEADLNERARAFLKNLDQVRAASNPEAIKATNVSREDVAPLSRVLGAVGGFFIGGIGSAVEGASMGMGQMANGLGIHLAAGIGLVLMGFGLPVVLPVLIGIGVARTFLTAKSEGNRIREEIVRQLSLGRRSSFEDRSLGTSISFTRKSLRGWLS
jgi:hypothetical protein